MKKEGDFAKLKEFRTLESTHHTGRERKRDSECEVERERGKGDGRWRIKNKCRSPFCIESFSLRFLFLNYS